MAVKDINMMTLINRELENIGSRRQRDYTDVLSETMRYAKEDRAWKERKNMQRQRIMSDLTKDTSRLYNNKDAQFQKDRFQKYFDRHKGDMDESTMEMGQMMLGNFEHQIEKNSDFSKYRDGMDFQMQKIDDFLKKPEFEVGKEYTDKEVDEFREVYQGYVDFTEKFMSDHADRLQLAGNSHVLQELSQGSYANKFMLDSFYGDKKIDETEYKAYSQALASNSIEPITKYKEYEKKIIKHSHESLLDSMDNNAELLRNYNLAADGAVDISAVLGREYSGSYEAGTEEAGMIDDMILSLEDELEEDDKRHIERYGKSYLYDPEIGILSKGKTTTTPKVKTPPPDGSPPPPQSTPKASSKILDPEVESANAKPMYKKAVIRATDKVNKAQEELDNLKANGVVPAYSTPSYGSAQQRVPTQTPIGKHLGLKEGESASIEQLRKMQAEYEKFTAKDKEGNNALEKEIKDIHKTWRNLPKDERKASKGDVNKKIQSLRKKLANFKGKWETKGIGGEILIKSVDAGIKRYEDAEDFYKAELNRLRDLQGNIKKD